MLKRGWQEYIINLGRAGGTLEEVLGYLEITKEEHAVLMKDNELYKKTIEKSSLLCQAWWVRFGRENLNDKNFNPSVFKFYMVNILGWDDKPVAEARVKKTLKDKTKELEMDAKYKNVVEKVDTVIN
jgi:hypothetical protein